MGGQGGPADLHPPGRRMMLVCHNPCTSLQCALVTENVPQLRLIRGQEKGRGGRGGREGIGRGYGGGAGALGVLRGVERGGGVVHIWLSTHNA